MSDHMLLALKEVVRQGVIVILSVGDSDRRFLQLHSSSIGTNDATLAYGYNEARVQFTPSPTDISRAEIVERWLVWLREQQGRRALERIKEWGSGHQIWLIAQREKCSGRTVINRIDRSMVAILREFLDEEANIEHIEEPPDKPVTHFQNGKAVAGFAGTRDSFGKVWIDGIGYMKDGRRLRDGRHKTEDKRLYRDRPR